MSFLDRAKTRTKTVRNIDSEKALNVNIEERTSTTFSRSNKGFNEPAETVETATIESNEFQVRNEYTNVAKD